MAHSLQGDLLFSLCLCLCTGSPIVRTGNMCRRVRKRGAPVFHFTDEETGSEVQSALVAGCLLAELGLRGPAPGLFPGMSVAAGGEC